MKKLLCVLCLLLSVCAFAQKRTVYSTSAPSTIVPEAGADLSDMTFQDSIDYYEKRIDRQRLVGNIMLGTGGVLLTGGVFGIVLATNWFIDYMDGIGGGYAIGAGVVVPFVAVGVYLLPVAAVAGGGTLLGLGIKNVTKSARSRRRLERYKEQYAVNVQVVPIVDPVNGNYGGALAMNF